VLFFADHTWEHDRHGFPDLLTAFLIGGTHLQGLIPDHQFDHLGVGLRLITFDSSSHQFNV